MLFEGSGSYSSNPIRFGNLPHQQLIKAKEN
jgi:hypothetical protein